VTTVAADRLLLAINAGSSSAKCALFTYAPAATLLARAVLGCTGATCAPALLAWVDAHARDAAIAAVGHRVVHGEPIYTQPQPLTCEPRLARLTFPWRCRILTRAEATDSISSPLIQGNPGFGANGRALFLPDNASETRGCVRQRDQRV